MRGKEFEKALARAAAPFGRIGRALGFRWAFPIGTMPIPYHPLIPLALLIGVPVWVLVEIAQAVGALGGGDSGGWATALGIALLLAIPLSIPIVSWMMMVFQMPRVQSLLIGGSMVMLSAEIVGGLSDPRLAVLPAGFVALYLVQRIGGPLYLRRLEAINAAFVPIDPGTRSILVEGDTVGAGLARWIIDHCDVAVVQQAHNPHARHALTPTRLVRLSGDDAARAADIIGEQRVPGWSLGKGDAPILMTPEADMGADPIFVRQSGHRSPLWLVTGRRPQLEIDVDGRVSRLVGGEAAVIRTAPMFTVFRWIAIFGGRSEWVVGFLRQKPVALGPARIYELVEQAFPPRGLQRARNHVPAGAILDQLSEAAAAARAAQAAARAAEIERFDALLANSAAPEEKMSRDGPLFYAEVRYRPEVTDGQGHRICDSLEAAKAVGNALGVVRYARLLANLSPGEFARIGSRMILLLNSKELAARLIDGPAPPPGTTAKDIPEAKIVGGYSLIKHVPALYERLGELGEPARGLIFGLGEMGHWPRALIEARRRLEQGAA